MIELNNVSFAYGKDSVLKDICLRLEKGRVHAVVGPNGSGKTTLIRLLSAQLRPARGEMLLCGKPYERWERKAFAREIALFPQERTIPDISVYELVSCARYPWLGLSRQLTEADKAVVHGALEGADALSLQARSVAELSGGERQRAYMAMLYAQTTPHVLLDEPTAYLDMAYHFQLMDSLRAMAADGKCVVVVLHELSLALQNADEVILMEKGRIAAVGTPREVVAGGRLQQVFGVDCRAVETDLGTDYVFRPLL